MTTQVSEKAKQIETAAAELGLTMQARFVRWSISRNAGEKDPSLNWKVTLLHKGKEVLTTDYMMGYGHCRNKPSKQGPPTVAEMAVIKSECEIGQGHNSPPFADFLYGIASDASAIDYADFEDWAESYGCNPDSRRDEAIYRACLDYAIRLRHALGESGLEKLRLAVQGY